MRRRTAFAVAAALSTILGIGTQLGTTGDENTLIQALRRGGAQSLNQTGQQIVGRNLNIQPTLTIRPGFPVRQRTTPSNSRSGPASTILANSTSCSADKRDFGPSVQWSKRPWVKHKGKPAVFGFKAHVGADAETALVEEVAITPANVNDGKAGPDALPDHPGEVFADSAYRGPGFRDAVLAKGGTPRIAATAMWGRDEKETLARLAAWNRPIHRVRGRIEKIFGTWKRSYGLRRMRWRSFAKAALQVRLTAIAYNLKRTLTLTVQAA